MAADVVEAAELSCSGPNEEEALPGHVEQEVVARLGHLFLPADAHPFGPEDPLPLPAPDLVGEIRVAVKGALQGHAAFPVRNGFRASRRISRAAL